MGTEILKCGTDWIECIWSV